MRVGCDGGESAPGLAYSDGGRTQTKGVSAVEPMKPGLAEAARPLSAALAPGAPMYLVSGSRAVLCLHICCSAGRAVLTALCISEVLVAVAH